MDESPEHEVTVFNAARRLAGGERTAYLDEACAGDAALRRRLDDLLRMDVAEGEFLEKPAHDGRGVPAIPLSLRLSERPGDRIGPYKLLQQIGEGGCGVVYMAEQERPIRRYVALKVIKLGMDTRQVIGRFEAEHQALALMDHPNIARVLDAGVAETGRPYFVMELVRGTKITDYCDLQSLPTRGRLDLFIKVCQAIQHAHQKGIIHRDIKPSNILVTINDGVAVPKVIDFGIAKATQGRLTDMTLFTAFEQFIGTPAYMSPEQAILTSLDVDTRSDIYSLGVLLYELLTGQTPFDAEDLLAKGLDEMRRTIREQEPRRPSNRLTTMDEVALTTTAQCRQTDPPKLVHLVQGDLDWIVMKCLEKDRNRRYETANGLLSDLQRHLNNEAVLARPPSNLYRIQKMARRNKPGLAALGAVVVALILGIAVSSWQAVRATRAERDQRLLREQAQAEEAKAKTEAAKSQQVSQFLKDMLAGVGPSKALGRDTMMLREILDKTAERLGKDMSNQPAVEIEIRIILAQTYRELGLFPKMDEMARLSLQLAQLRPGEENIAVAEALYLHGAAQRELGNYWQSEQPARQALAMRRKLLGNEHPDVAASLHDLAMVFWKEGRLGEAETLDREALAMQRKLLGNENRVVAGTLAILAHVLQRENKLTESEAMLREAVAMQRKLLGNQDPLVAASLNNLALILTRQGKHTEAETIDREALAIQEKVLGSEHPYVAFTLNYLAYILGDQGRFAESEIMQRKAVAIARKSMGLDHPESARMLNDLVHLLITERKFDEAAQVADNVLIPSGEGQQESPRLLFVRGNERAQTGRWREAVADFTKLRELEPANELFYPPLASLLVQRGDVEGYRSHCATELARFGNTKDPVIAERTAKDCLILPDSGVDLALVGQLAETAVRDGQASDYLPYFQFAKALAEYRLGHVESAAGWAQKVLLASGTVDFRDAEAWTLLAMSHEKLTGPAQAREALAKANGIIDTKSPKSANGDFGETWHDWVIARTLFEEAKELIARPTPEK